MDFSKFYNFYQTYLDYKINDLSDRLDHNQIDIPYPDFSTTIKGRQYEMLNRYKPHLSLKREIKKVFGQDVFTYSKLTDKHAELVYTNEFNQKIELSFYIYTYNSRVDMYYAFYYSDYKCLTSFYCYPFGLQPNINPCLKNMFHVYELINREVVGQFNLTIGLITELDSI